MPIKVNQLGKRDQLFTYFDADDGNKEYCFAVSRLRDYLLHKWPESKNDQHRMIRYDYIDPDRARCWVKDRGIEVHRLMRLTPEQVEEPMIVIEWHDGIHHVTIDGHHRYVRRFIDKEPLFFFYQVPETIWRRFLVTGLPDIPKDRIMEFIGGRSGL